MKRMAKDLKETPVNEMTDYKLYTLMLEFPSLDNNANELKNALKSEGLDLDEVEFDSIVHELKDYLERVKKDEDVVEIDIFMKIEDYLKRLNRQFADMQIKS